MKRYERKYGMKLGTKIIVALAVLLVVVSGLLIYVWKDSSSTLTATTKSDPKEFSLLVSKISERSLPVGKNLAVEIFNYMNTADGGVISGSYVKKVSIPSEAEMLHKYDEYKMEKKSRNTQDFLKAYYRTLEHARSGGVCEPGKLLVDDTYCNTTIPKGWSRHNLPKGESWVSLEEFQM